MATSPHSARISHTSTPTRADPDAASPAGSPGSSLSPEPAEPLLPLPRGEIIAGRYQVDELLGRGGFAEVYRVSDRREADRPRALKIHRVVAGPAFALEALRGEFALLASLSHPNLGAVHDFGYAGEEVAFFTQDLVEGVRFDAIDEPVGSARWVDLVAQLCRALEYLHRRGILHRDIKPSNVLVNAGRDHLTLLDFGIARAFGPRRGDLLVGTHEYLATEAIAGGPMDARADLYALGVTLYRAAAGHEPFRGDTAEVLQAHLEAPPPPLPPGSVPAGLEPVIARLLRKEPGERYASASELLAAIGEATGVPVELETASTLASYVLSPRFVGGEGPAAELVGRALDPAGGKPPALIVGEAGTGKSRLLGEVRHRVQLAGRTWIAVDLHRAEGSRTLEHEIGAAVIIPRVADALSEYDRIDLARVLPELRRPRQRIGIAVDPDRALEARIEALARAVRLRFDGKAGVLAVEDLHWAPSEVLQVFCRIVAAVRAGGARCLVIATARPGPAVETVASTLKAARFECAPLAPAVSRLLVESMFGEPALLNSTELGASLRAGPQTALTVQEALRLAVESGAIVRRGGRWTVTGDLPARPLVDLLAARVRALAKKTQAVAAATAVLGRGATAAEVAAVCGGSIGAVAPALTDAVRSGIIEARRDARGHAVYAMHDRFVDVVLANLPATAARAAHRRAARWLGRRRRDWRALALAAGHFERASDARAAAEAFDAAATEADRAGRPDIGVQMVDRSLELVARAGGSGRIRLLLQKHDLASKAGIPQAVREALDAVGEEEASAPQRVEIALRRAGAEARGGDGARARRRCRWALRRARALGLEAARSRLLLLLAELDASFGTQQRAFARYLVTAHLARRLRLRDTEAAAWHGAAFLATAVGRAEEGAAGAGRAVRAAAAAGDRALESEALRQLGTVYRERGQLVRSTAIYRRAVRAARESGNLEAEAKALNNLALSAQWCGDVEAALEAYQRSLALKGRTRAVTSLWVGQNNLASFLITLGRHDEARRLLEGIPRRTGPDASHAVAAARANLGDLCALEGRMFEAIRLYRAAAEAHRRSGPAINVLHPLCGLVRTHLMRGGRGSMARAGAALAAFRRIERTRSMPRAGRLLATCTAMLADAQSRPAAALEAARRALGVGGPRARFSGVFGTLIETEWIYALMLDRCGRHGESRRALERARLTLVWLTRRVGDAAAQRRFLDGHPVHREIIEGRFDTPPGWTWHSASVVGAGG